MMLALCFSGPPVLSSAFVRVSDSCQLRTTKNIKTKGLRFITPVKLTYNKLLYTSVLITLNWVASAAFIAWKLTSQKCNC
jgi:hypothetical protein